MADVSFDEVDKVYDNGFHAVQDLTLDIHDFHFTEFDRLVAPQLIAANLEELRGRRAVAGKESVEDASRFIARMPGIADKHAAQTSAEHERRAQSRWAATDNDGIENLFVERA